MFFEGSEKKIEIMFKSSAPALRSMEYSFWEDVVWAAGAKILSKVSNEHMDAYLLSESSLFVYDKYIIMITCGRTRLVQAVKKILSVIKPLHVDAFFYERKHEVFPQYQSTDFFEDSQKLKKWFKGESMRFGKEDEHHLFLFSTTAPYQPQTDDHTMEILMHGVGSQRIDLFRKETSNSTNNKSTEVHALVSGTIDDYLFEPCGYSLNAIDGPYYYTLHVTPEKIGNYTSFETDSQPPEKQEDMAQKVVTFFEPDSFDVVLFNRVPTETPFQFEGYRLKTRYKQQLPTGYMTEYFTYYKPQVSVEGAFLFEEMS